MRFIGIVMGIIGGVLFVSHLVDDFFNGERTGNFRIYHWYHWLSLIGGGAMVMGISLYIIARRRASHTYR